MSCSSMLCVDHLGVRLKTLMVVGVWSNDMGFGQLGRGGIEDIRAMFVAVHPVRQLLCVVERYLSVALISVALQHRIVEPEPDGSLALSPAS